MNKHLWACAGTAILALFITGCAALGINPPFDATGVYRGVWEGTVQGGASGDRTCAVSFDLSQSPDYQLLQGFAIEGEATVYFSCASMLDDIAENGLPARVSLKVQGFLLANGRIVFSSVESGPTQSVLITVTGTGLDNDQSGTMDQIEAGWTLIIDQPSHPRITINGTVDASST